MKITKLISNILFFSLLASPAFAESGHRDKGFHKIIKKLDLTDAQKKQLDEFKSVNKEDMHALKKSMRSVKEEMAAGFVANASDEKLQVFHDKITKIKSQMGEAKFKKLLFLKKTLTEKQRKEFMSLKKRHKKKRSH